MSKRISYSEWQQRYGASYAIAIVSEADVFGVRDIRLIHGGQFIVLAAQDRDLKWLHNASNEQLAQLWDIVVQRGLKVRGGN